MTNIEKLYSCKTRDEEAEFLYKNYPYTITDEFKTITIEEIKKWLGAEYEEGEPLYEE